MKLQIIETPDYILAVSDEEVKEGDLCFLKENHYVNGGVGIYNHQRAIGWGISYSPNGHNFFQKIIAYQPKNNAPELDLPLLPEIVVEDDVEKLAEKYADFSNDYIPMSFGGKFNETSKRDFIAGYKSATKVYSEEDMRKAFEAGNKRGWSGYPDTDNWTKPKFEEFIQSLKQPKTPKWFVAEMEEVSRLMTTDIVEKEGWVKVENSKYTYQRLKTTTINDKTYLT